uniref:Immunoglobulin domain-containing protein n=1 Tax=Salmo trutta TaxID=8032 RepID=A0A674E2X7_SALTR
MSVLQQPVSESVQPGDSVTLNCTIHTETCPLQILKQISKLYNITKDFTGTQHLIVKRGVDSFNLTISKTQLRDSATYYCAAIEVGKVTFGQGADLIVKSNSMSVAQQPLSESTCAGEHSVYWFRHGSGESHPGIIYTHGNRSDHCVYNLPKILVLLSIIRTGVLVCCLTIFIIISTTRK